MSTDAKTPLVIGVIVFDGVVQQDYIGVTSYLEQLPTVCDQPVKFFTISLTSGPLRCRNPLGFGMPLYATHGFEDVKEHIDILVIPGGRGRLEMQKHEAFIKFLKGIAQTATFVLTVCTGSAILATTGLLDDKQATTNKLAYQDVVEAHPTVNWIHKARWVQDGKIWTSSGVTAGMDMAYAFMTSTYGVDAAVTMARYLENVPNTDPNDDPFATV
ncbi:ThiJ/PfpI family protein [Phytophthora megakarya]|uniref:ThiJ/PfpI family protein n=1 Tax=Phytophthora megakarya TaxID=4795 RepID=A0A225X411_9STRA|nr:ThiJ/PfpI family protein [Phytophthora megakarya]